MSDVTLNNVHEKWTKFTALTIFVFFLSLTILLATWDIFVLFRTQYNCIHYCFLYNTFMSIFCCLFVVSLSVVKVMNREEWSHVSTTSRLQQLHGWWWHHCEQWSTLFWSCRCCPSSSSSSTFICVLVPVLECVVSPSRRQDAPTHHLHRVRQSQLTTVDNDVHVSRLTWHTNAIATRIVNRFRIRHPPSQGIF